MHTICLKYSGSETFVGSMGSAFHIPDEHKGCYLQEEPIPEEDPVPAP